MKTLLALLLTLSLSGCFYQKVDTSDIIEASKICGSAEQILHIRADALGKEAVYCSSGKSKYLHQNINDV